MKRYQILLMLPGGATQIFEKFTVEATKFTIEGGVYYFRRGEALYKTFPACFTIIDSIEEITEKKK